MNFICISNLFIFDPKHLCFAYFCKKNLTWIFPGSGSKIAAVDLSDGSRGGGMMRQWIHTDSGQWILIVFIYRWWQLKYLFIFIPKIVWGRFFQFDGHAYFCNFLMVFKTTSPSHGPGTSTETSINWSMASCPWKPMNNWGAENCQGRIR